MVLILPQNILSYDQTFRCCTLCRHLLYTVSVKQQMLTHCGMQVLGESEQKTAAILDATVGCVLVIDEAYGLNPVGSIKGGDPFKVRCVRYVTPASNSPLTL